MNGSIEYMQLNYHFSNKDDNFAVGSKKHFINSLPVCQSVTEVSAEEEKSSSDFYVVTMIPKEILDNFLKEKFKGLELFDFMKNYARLHMGQEFLLPVPESIICMFYKANDVETLNRQINSYENILTRNLNDGPLNLHDNSIATFTLVEATDLDFSKLWGGYQYSNGKFNFFIKSSIQFDLVIIYERKKQGV